MKSHLVLVLATLVFLTTATPSQTNSTDNPSGPNATIRVSALEAGLARFLDSDGEPITRPRTVKETSAVASLVVVNTLAVERTAFEIINQKRVENGFPRLIWSDELAGVARLHSRNMAELHFFSHRGLDSKFVSDRADDLGLGRWRAIGENIAYNRGFQDPIAKAVELWLGSTTHRNNLLDPGWKESALGVAIGEDGSYFFTQVFLRK